MKGSEKSGIFKTCGDLSNSMNEVKADILIHYHDECTFFSEDRKIYWTNGKIRKSLNKGLGKAFYEIWILQFHHWLDFG